MLRLNLNVVSRFDEKLSNCRASDQRGFDSLRNLLRQVHIRLHTSAYSMLI